MEYLGPDEILLLLLKENVVTIVNADFAGLIMVVVYCSDFFGPGSDCEQVSYYELSELYNLYINKGYNGITEFVANKRGIENVCWKEKLKS